MKKILTIILILGLALGGLIARTPPVNRAYRDAQPRYGLENRRNELELTDAQIKKFAEARAVYQKQDNSLSADIKNLKLDLDTALKAENFKRVKELNKQISNKELELKNARIDLIMAQLSELNAQQKEIWKERPHQMTQGFGRKPDFHSAQERRPNLLRRNMRPNMRSRK